MEKDYFRDRPVLVQQHAQIAPGDQVFICLKENQPCAKTLDDLTLVTVTAHLTSQAVHPRGQKVCGIEKIWDEADGRWKMVVQKGRVTYKVLDGWKVPTSEGIKYLCKTGKGLRLKTADELKNSYRPALDIVFACWRIRMVPDLWIWLEGRESFQQWQREAKLTIDHFDSTGISGSLYGKPVLWTDLQLFCKAVPAACTWQNLNRLSSEISRCPENLKARWILVPAKEK